MWTYQRKQVHFRSSRSRDSRLVVTRTIFTWIEFELYTFQLMPLSIISQSDSYEEASGKTEPKTRAYLSIGSFNRVTLSSENNLNNQISLSQIINHVIVCNQIKAQQQVQPIKRSLNRNGFYFFLFSCWCYKQTRWNLVSATANSHLCAAAFRGRLRMTTIGEMGLLTD